MEKLYNRIDFHNDTVPALNDANLNAMSKAIDDLDNRIINLPVVITEESIEKAEAAAERAEEVLESIPSDYSALSAEVQTKADKTQLTNRNLLDNGWFTVNQRGQSSYGGYMVYSADRWRTMGGAIGGNFIVDNNGLTFRYVENEYNVIDQVLSTPLSSGDVVTISIKIGSEIHSRTITVGEGGDYKQIGTSPIWVNVDQLPSVLRIYDMQRQANTTVRAVKLELGSISTLANDVAPNYADELIKCQGSTADSSDTYANDGVWQTNSNFKYVRKNGVVTVVLQYSDAVNSDGMTLPSVLPLGYRPQTEVKIPIFVFNGSSYVNGTLNINPNGNVKVSSPFDSAISGMQLKYSYKTVITYVI